MTTYPEADAEDPIAAPVVTPARRAEHRRAGIAIGVVALAGAFFYFFTRSDLWLDEALSVNIARLPLSDLQPALERDGAPPLYYVLLHLWTAVFGTSEIAVRSLSGVCMAGAVVALWFVAKRLGGSRLAAIVVLLMASSPYAIRYATEARMYALVVLLVACGILAFQRTVETPTAGRATVFGLVVALAMYTQYWTFYLILITVVLLGWMWSRKRDARAARLMLAGVAGACVAFLPWVPTFLAQRAHTGTPWGTAVLPSIPFAYTLRDFAGGASGTQADRQEGWLLFFVLFSLLLLGIFGRAVDERHVEIDVRTQPPIRRLLFVGGAGLVVAVSLNYVAGNAFESRYSSIVFPFFILLAAIGATLLLDRRIAAAVLTLAVLFGVAGGVRNVMTQRTQAGEVADALRAGAKPGDVVVYCPDQLGPSVHRLLPDGLVEVTYPSFAGPELVDWYDYKAQLRAADLNAFAAEALQRADGHTLWYVWAPGYKTHVGTCESLSEALGAKRDRRDLTTPEEETFEKPALQVFTAR